MEVESEVCPSCWGEGRNEISFALCMHCLGEGYIIKSFEDEEEQEATT